MKRDILVYGLIGGVLIAAMSWTEYRFVLVEPSIGVYGGLTALVFAALGIWLGVRLARQRGKASVGTAEQAPPPVACKERRSQLGITPRELEVLGLIAQGLSTREIAGTLNVSENTVKTHSSRVMDKLGARRRTQAVQLSREMGLLG